MAVLLRSFLRLVQWWRSVCVVFWWSEPGSSCFNNLLVCVCVRLPASVVRVGALGVVHVSGEHVVVHVDGAAVVDGVTQPLRHDGLAGVRRQTELEETRLRGREAVVRLRRKQKQQVCLQSRGTNQSSSSVFVTSNTGIFNCDTQINITQLVYRVLNKTVSKFVSHL